MPHVTHTHTHTHTIRSCDTLHSYYELVAQTITALNRLIYTHVAFSCRSHACAECPAFDPLEKPSEFHFDVVVIGAGCVGACIARELSK